MLQMTVNIVEYINIKFDGFNSLFVLMMSSITFHCSVLELNSELTHFHSIRQLVCDVVMELYDSCSESASTFPNDLSIQPQHSAPAV